MAPHWPSRPRSAPARPAQTSRSGGRRSPPAHRPSRACGTPTRRRRGAGGRRRIGGPGRGRRPSPRPRPGWCRTGSPGAGRPRRPGSRPGSPPRWRPSSRGPGRDGGCWHRRRRGGWEGRRAWPCGTGCGWVEGRQGVGVRGKSVRGRGRRPPRGRRRERPRARPGLSPSLCARAALPHRPSLPPHVKCSPWRSIPLPFSGRSQGPACPHLGLGWRDDDGRLLDRRRLGLRIFRRGRGWHVEGRAARGVRVHLVAERVRCGVLELGTE